MKTLKLLAVTAALILGLTGIASADIITTVNAPAVGPTLTDFDWSLVFGATPTPAGYHLVGATLEVTENISDPTLTLTNTASQSETFHFTATSWADINTNSVDSTLVGSQTSPDTVLAVHPTLASGASTAYGPISLSESTGAVAVSDPSGYLGGFTLTGDTMSGSSFVGGGGNIAVDQVQYGTIGGQVVFDFAPNATPEPGFYGLVAGGLGCLFLVRRRKQTKA